MKKLIVFDLDGTLAESKSSLDAEMSTLLRDLLSIVQVAVISGGGWQQFETALLNNSFKSGVFCYGLDPPVYLKERFYDSNRPSAVQAHKLENL